VGLAVVAARHKAPSRGIRGKQRNGTRPRCLEAGEGKTVPEPTSALWLTVARYITGTARRGVNVPPAVRIALRDVVAAAVIPE